MGGAWRIPFGRLAVVAALVAVPLIRVPLVAAEGISDRIEELSRSIRVTPGEAALYLQRGELYRVHRQWARAKADYDQAARLDPSLILIEYARGRMYLESNQPELARASLDRFLAADPQNSGALLCRARALVRMGHPAAAVADYDAAILHATNPTCEIYHERAKVLAGLGRDDEALRGLDDAIGRFGPLVSLELQAIEIDTRRERFERALARLDVLASTTERRESFLAEKGEILEKAGRPAEAQQAYMRALDAIAALPPAARGERMTRDLEARIRAALLRQGPQIGSASGSGR